MRNTTLHLKKVRDYEKEFEKIDFDKSGDLNRSELVEHFKNLKSVKGDG